MIRRPPRSTLSSSSAASDVYKRQALGRLRDLASFAPKKVKKAPCQDVVLRGDEVNLDLLPVLQCWPLDAGRFVTLPLVFTRDPRTGVRNTGMYRLQVFDRNTTGMHWHLHKDGKEIYESYKKIGGRMPVSVALGCDPAVT